MESNMNLVERYNVDVEKNDNGYWEGVLFVSANGEWVRYSDFEALQRENAELRDRLQISPQGDDAIDALESAVEQLRDRAEDLSRQLAEVENDRDRYVEGHVLY